MEISFDDKALSTYNVSVSKTFKEPEDALYYLLSDKPFKIEKVNHVYIIVPTETKMAKNNPITVSIENNDKFVFTGTVSDIGTKEPLLYAAVCLLNSDNQPIATGITNDKGIFRLISSQFPQKIKISFIGYETMTRDISNFNVELGLFPMQTATIPLEETIITADKIRHKVDRISYQVTSSMLQGATNAEELLGKLPGIYFDKVSNVIKVNNSRDILLLVDGMQQSADYIKNLPPARISSIEVINETSGRFISDGYTAIINLVLKKDYKGSDIYASNFSAVNTSGSNGSDWLVLEQPTVRVAYTDKKVNMYATYSYNKENQNLPVSKELIYNGIELISSDVSMDNPNDSYKHESNNLTGGFHYQPTSNQVIGIQGDYISGKTNTHQVYTMQRTDIMNQQRRIIKNTTANIMKDNTFVGTLFYQGQINNRLQLYSDFSYNYYYNDINNGYNQNDSKNFESGNAYNEYKNHTLFNVEGQYLLSPNASINAGYSNAWRKYGSESSHGKGFLDYREYRNKAFAYFLFNPTQKIQTKLGVAVEHIKSYDRDSANNYVRVLPYVQANFNISKKANVNVSYSTNQHYASLYQLSPMNMVIDTFLTQIGNPQLKSAIRHNVFVRVALWDKLTIMPMFSYTHNEISELYVQKEYKLYRTFNNIDTKEYSIQATYDQPLGKYFRFKKMITYYCGKALNAEIKNTPDGWLIDSELSYYHPGKTFGLQFGYHRNMKKHIVSQGYQMFDKDNWLITANKELWNKRISVSLSYIPPISLGVRYNQLRVLETSLYKEITNLYLKSYNNMLMLKISIRFDRGSSKPVERRTTIRKDEREKQTIEFQ